MCVSIHFRASSVIERFLCGGTQTIIIIIVVVVVR